MVKTIFRPQKKAQEKLVLNDSKIEFDENGNIIRPKKKEDE